MNNLSDSDILAIALESGFMVSTMYGQDPPKLMPTSDLPTLVDFARKILAVKE